MSVIGLSVNKTAVKPVTKICYDNNLVTSQGVFLGDDPLLFSLPTLLLEMSLIFICTSTVHFFLQRLGQPKAISQIVTGILLGPSVMGRSFNFTTTVFPARGTFILDTCSFFGLILFLFNIGVKTDISLLRKASRRDIAIGVTSSVVPFALTSVVYFLKHESFSEDYTRGNLILYLAERLSLSSFAVISEALDELGLLNSDLGRIVMSSTLIADIVSWVVTVLITTGTLIVQARTAAIAVSTLCSMVGFTLFITFIARPLTLRMVKRVPPGELIGEGFFLGLLVAALSAALITEVTGYHPVLGPFFLGILIPGGMPIGVTLTERLDALIGLFAPLYLVLAGYRTAFTNIGDWSTWVPIGMVFATTYVGKIIGTVGPALYFKMSLRDAVTMALMLNIKGVMEIWFFNTLGDTEVANSAHFTLMMLSLIITTSITTPIVKFVYDPTVHYIANKRRTVQHVKPHSPLRILACVHNDDHVAPLIDLLEATYPSARSPLSLHLLHLTELAGRATSVLRPYKNRRSNSSANPSPTDRIVNAFPYFEQQHPCGAVSLHAFVAISPIATMHNDVCSLALTRKCHLIVLPFHKQSDGARETAKASLQNLNHNVLGFAPCSVAVLVDRGGSIACAQTNHLLQRAVVYFLGGADDREALAVAMRMVSGEVMLTVVRFRARDEEAEVDEADEEAIGECRAKYGDSEGVVFVEKIVADGEGTMAVMMGMNEKFNIVIVGRRKGVDYALTSGLSAWSEYPELGTLGDTLAATEFGGKVSILVVQQHESKMRLARSWVRAKFFGLSVLLVINPSLFK